MDGCAHPLLLARSHVRSAPREVETNAPNSWRRRLIQARPGQSGPSIRSIKVTNKATPISASTRPSFIVIPHSASSQPKMGAVDATPVAAMGVIGLERPREPSPPFLCRNAGAV